MTVRVSGPVITTFSTFCALLDLMRWLMDALGLTAGCSLIVLAGFVLGDAHVDSGLVEWSCPPGGARDKPT